MATVYAVASAKGGVGKTTTTAAIATVLAETGADVVAIDADVGMANLADALGMVPGETTIHDVLAGRADPDEAVHDGPAGLRVVPGDPDLDAYAAADPTELAGVVEAFADAEYVFLDSGAGLSHDSTLPVGLADETLLVSTPDRSALGDTEKTRQLAERIGGTVAGAAITRVGGAEDESDGPGEVDGTAEPDDPAVDIVDEILATTVLARIPEDPTVARATTAGEPLTTFDPEAPASRAYRELARTLTGFDVPEPNATGTRSDPDAETEGDAEPDAETEGDAEPDAEVDAEPDAETEGDAGDSEATEGAEDIEDAEDVEDAEDAECAGDEGAELIEEAEPGPDADGNVEPDVDDAGDAGGDDVETADDGTGTDGPKDADGDEDLAGSIPFRDDDTGTTDADDTGTTDADDTGTMDTALTGASDDDREGSDGEDDEDEGDGGDGEDDDGKKGGFFSRLFGR
ncbi:cobyrinic acid ac-diamide synthase [Halorubrum sp. 48-1-W]|uniref:nucleotide-binding protein n=1 Tax=Halorubrum sp. 48-1-W TaxID=2249761 RepID=UPI000DCBD979|nr:P-loop NTPase [Halorubrum sp. 48-1-W]RAW44198.1 cobyrinic acid ac-diamide synthase [Halorubrum sp. 48-1-W]